jgi:hypothetical protein
MADCFLNTLYTAILLLLWSSPRSVVLCEEIIRVICEEGNEGRELTKSYFNITTHIFHRICYNFMPLYRVFTKEWCGFKNLLNDYILKLDGAPPPPFSQECTRATQSCSPTALERTCFKWRQSHTHTIWDEFDYLVNFLNRTILL